MLDLVYVGSCLKKKKEGHKNNTNLFLLVLGSEKAEVEAAVALHLAAGFPIPRGIFSL